MKKMTGAQILWECLVREGVTTVFGYPGGTILPSYDTLSTTRRSTTSWYATSRGPLHGRRLRADQRQGRRGGGDVGPRRHEPGHRDRHGDDGLDPHRLHHRPGRVEALGSDAFQESDITGITVPITKHNALVTDVKDLARTLNEAFYIARSGRPGPVHVDICKDAQQATTEFRWPEARGAPGQEERPASTEAEADQPKAAELIAAAERPVILAGHGGDRQSGSTTAPDGLRGEDQGRPSRSRSSGSAAFPAATRSASA